MGIVYKALSPNGKCYIGRTSKSLEVRKNEHKTAANNGNFVGFNSKFYRAIRKYGYQNFHWFVVYEGDDFILKERSFIKIYNSFIGGYNSSAGGEGVGQGAIPWNIGKRHSENSKKKMSDSQKYRLRKDPKNHGMFGKKHSLESKLKMSKAWENKVIGKNQLLNLKLGRALKATFKILTPSEDIIELLGQEQVRKYFEDKEASFSSLLKYGYSKGYRLVRRGY